MRTLARARNTYKVPIVDVGYREIEKVQADHEPRQRVKVRRRKLLELLKVRIRVQLGNARLDLLLVDIPERLQRAAAAAATAHIVAKLIHDNAAHRVFS